jgi:Fe-S cluster assembly protein SufD
MTSSTPLPSRDSYLAELLQTIAPPTEANPWLTALRTQAQGFLQEQTIPSNRDEDWRFTSLKGLQAQQFALPNPHPQIDLQSLDLADLPQRLVLVDGIVAPELSRVSAQSQVFVGNLAQAIEHHIPIGDHLGKQPGGEEVFTALNTSGFRDVATVWIKGESSTPIHIVHIGTGAGTIAQPRILVVLDRQAQGTLVEEYRDLSGARRFTNSVAEIYLEAGAHLQHIRIQQENQATFHIGKTTVSQSQTSNYQGYTVSCGGELSRHHWEIFQTGNQTSTQIYGLSLVGGEQTADTHSKIALNHPHGQTDQLHKCIITGKGHGIFAGQVIVPQAAQQTNAAQLSRTLLLSPTARIDTKPQLEITADDVKCSHGATVSQLSDDELFYLQSRGLGLDMSRALLVNAFGLEVIDSIPIPEVRQQLIQALHNFSV